MRRIGKLLEPILRLEGAVYLIPGNHDPYLLFKGGVISEKMMNMEGRIISIGEGLDMMGIGGSVPGYMSGELKW